MRFQIFPQIAYLAQQNTLIQSKAMIIIAIIYLYDHRNSVDFDNKWPYLNFTYKASVADYQYMSHNDLL